VRPSSDSLRPSEVVDEVIELKMKLARTQELLQEQCR
jgi:hypothetical protein